MRIIISGHNGFIGQHLIRNLKIYKQNYEIQYLVKSDFKSVNNLKSKLTYDDIIFHFAGINRDKSPEKVYDKNIYINNILHDALEEINFKGKLLFTSSIQENTNSEYGKAKKLSREKFKKQSLKLGYTFFGILCPNVYGPFCRPNYNSFISTFSYKLINSETQINIENKIVSLIYIDNLIKEFLKIFENIEPINLQKHTFNKSVKGIYLKLQKFHNIYYKKGEIPNINSVFDLSLFNTFRSYIDYKDFFPKKHILNKDERGNFSEILRSYSKGQFSFSTTKPGIVRGNHFHTRKIERFSIISGKAKVQLREILSDQLIEFKVDGNVPSFIDMPIWNTHNIENIGSTPLVTLFWINEHYNESDPDTFAEKV